MNRDRSVAGLLNSLEKLAAKADNEQIITVVAKLKNTIPGDYYLLKNWFNVIKECFKISHTGGYARLDLSVWVDEHGVPCFWEKPVVTRIHPRACNVQEVLNHE